MPDTEPSSAEELLRELLNVGRELERLGAKQARLLESIEFFVREGASQAARNRFHEQAARHKAALGRILRRPFHAQGAILDWLRGRGLHLSHFTSDGLPSGPADEIAERLAAGYPVLHRLHKVLVRAHETKEGIAYPLRGHGPDERQILLAFAQRLEDLGFVQEMNVAGDRIHIQPLLDSGLEVFLSGFWLERAVFARAAAFGHGRWSPEAILANSCHRAAGGAAFEFDLLVPSDDGVVYMDCKCGNITEGVRKSARRNLAALGLPPERALIIRPVIRDEEDRARWCRAIPEATVLALSEIEAHLLSLHPEPARP